MKFRKKPVIIEAVQFTQEVHDKGPGHWPTGVLLAQDPKNLRRVRPVITTLEGDMEVSIGDWIITGVKGERYPCKDDIFKATYESPDGNIPPDEDGWTVETWKAFYFATKPFIDGTHPTIVKLKRKQ